MSNKDVAHVAIGTGYHEFGARLHVLSYLNTVQRHALSVLVSVVGARKGNGLFEWGRVERGRSSSTRSEVHFGLWMPLRGTLLFLLADARGLRRLPVYAFAVAGNFAVPQGNPLLPKTTFVTSSLLGRFALVIHIFGRRGHTPATTRLSSFTHLALFVF